MPIYEYECPECGVFEARHGINEAPLTCKPECDNAKCPKAAKKLISASALKFNGTGFYLTDYKNTSSSGTSSSGGSKSPESASGGDSGKKETKEASSKPGGCGTTCGCH